MLKSKSSSSIKVKVLLKKNIYIKNSIIYIQIFIFKEMNFNINKDKSSYIEELEEKVSINTAKILTRIIFMLQCSGYSRVSTLIRLG